MILRILLGGVCLILLSACNSKQYLQDGQSFLKDNKIAFKSKYKIPNRSELSDELVEYFDQPKTRTFAGIPRHVFYYRYQNRLIRNPEIQKWDNKKLEKFKPVIYDSLLAKSTTEKFTKYLQLRGYRFASSSYVAKTSNKETIVYYTVNPGPVMNVDSFNYVVDDPAIEKIILDPKNLRNTFLKKRTALDIKAYENEKIRITKLLLNEGYADFDASAIGNLQIDTSGGRIVAILPIHNKQDSSRFRIHKFGDLVIYPDFNTPATVYHDSVYNGITYKLSNVPVFTLKPEVIDRNIFVRTGDIARQNEMVRTLRALQRMPTIGYVNPIPRLDTLEIDTPLIHYTFQINRNSKIETSGNLDFTYANVPASQSNSLLGVSGGLSYQDLNLLNGGEVFNINAETGFEFNFFNRNEEKTLRLINSTNVTLGTNIAFPRFMDPLRIYNMIGYKKEESTDPPNRNSLREWLNHRSRSKLSTSYSYSFVRNYLSSYTFNINLSYDIIPDDFRKLLIERIGFELNVPIADSSFQTILDNNTFLRESNGKRLFTGLLFKGFVYEIKSRQRRHTGYFNLIQSFEISGLELLGLNLLTNEISNTSHQWTIGKTSPVLFSHFVRGEVNLTYTRDYSPSLQLACRVNVGLAAPYGPFSTQVPYVKQFFLGGPLSNRGWQIRELGPGSYEDTHVDPNLQFYQTGDFKIDLSAELRFKMFWVFKGAIFMDAGNVWTLKKDIQRPGTTVGSFFQEFGVSYGYGIRADLSFFLIRLDVGYKLFYPYPVDGKRLAKHDLRKFPGGGEPQIAVGLPF